jgi:hypothetical protein
MKDLPAVAYLERLEDQLQALKWVVWTPPSKRRVHLAATQSIVAQTAGLLRGRLPPGRAYQRRIRREWEQRFSREAT